jgi:hypothetical protein
MLSRHRSHLSLLIDEQTETVLTHADGEAVTAAHNTLTAVLGTTGY